MCVHAETLLDIEISKSYSTDNDRAWTFASTEGWGFLFRRGLQQRGVSGSIVSWCNLQSLCVETPQEISYNYHGSPAPTLLWPLLLQELSCPSSQQSCSSRVLRGVFWAESCLSLVSITPRWGWHTWVHVQVSHLTLAVRGKRYTLIIMSNQEWGGSNKRIAWSLSVKKRVNL